MSDNLSGGETGPPANELSENKEVKDEESCIIDKNIQEYQVIKAKCDKKEDINPFLQWLHLNIPIPPTSMLDMKILDDAVKFFLESVYKHINYFKFRNVTKILQSTSNQPYIK